MKSCVQSIKMGTIFRLQWKNFNTFSMEKILTKRIRSKCSQWISLFIEWTLQWTGLRVYGAKPAPVMMFDHTRTWCKRVHMYTHTCGCVYVRAFVFDKWNNAIIIEHFGGWMQRSHTVGKSWIWEKARKKEKEKEMCPEMRLLQPMTKLPIHFNQRMPSSSRKKLHIKSIAWRYSSSIFKRIFRSIDLPFSFLFITLLIFTLFSSIFYSFHSRIDIKEFLFAKSINGFYFRECFELIL